MLTLYVREYCELCQRMLAQLQARQAAQPFALAVVDIDDDDALEQRYATLIPVLAENERILCFYHLDQRALDAYLSAIG